MVRYPAKPNGQNNSYTLRIFLLMVVICGMIFLILYRMFSLQVVNYKHYRALAANQHEFERTILPTRGEIYMTSVRTQEPVLVATNISKQLVFAVPKEIKDVARASTKLAEILNMDINVVLQKLTTENSSYVPLKKQLTDEEVNKIKDLGLPGVHMEAETVRYYPENNLGSQILGFVGYRGVQRVGQYGIEGNYEQELAGSTGVMGLEKDLAGRWITVAARNLIPASNGDSIYLTIDSAIQYRAQEVIKRSVVEHGAERGSVVVLNPKTGAVLAMANYPDFNPNEYNKVEDPAAFANSALSLDYEPGSVFKPLTMAAAINEGKVRPDSTYEDTGVVEMDDFKIKNSDGKAYGIQTMNDVLEKSLNTGMVFAEKELGHSQFKKYVEHLGFGQKTKIELPGEVLGNLDNLQKKGDIFFATAAFGQGITATPIQVIASYTALANGGKLMQPYVVDRIKRADGSEEVTEPKRVAEVFSSRTAAQVTAMLVNVVENGHGKRAAVPGYFIAGKTGTAQVAYTDRTGYDPSKSIGSFVGYGPVDDPAFLMLVRVDNPKDVKFAESTAAPAFGEIASFILNYLQVPPTR